MIEIIFVLLVFAAVLVRRRYRYARKPRAKGFLVRRHGMVRGHRIKKWRPGASPLAALLFAIGMVHVATGPAPYDYLITKSGTTYSGRASNGRLVSSGTNAATVVNAVVADASAGDYIKLQADLTITAQITLNKRVVFDLNLHTVTQTTAGAKGLVITASRVKVYPGELVGPQFAAIHNDERAISIEGPSAAAAIAGTEVYGVTATNWGGYGIYAKWANQLSFELNTIEDVRYAGIMAISCIGGHADVNFIENITGSVVENAYGIAITREQITSLVTDPRSENWSVAFNQITNVANWEGIDTHAGKNITITGNLITGCQYGIAAGPSNNTGGSPTYAPLNTTITYNTIISGVTDGSAELGITVVGATTEWATGKVYGNTVDGHGDESNTESGGIGLSQTRGVDVQGNTLHDCSPAGIVLRGEAVLAEVSGNVIIDPWTETAGIDRAIMVKLGSTTHIHSNSFVRSDKVATHVLGTGIKLDNTAGVAALIGTNKSDATVYLEDSGNKRLNPPAQQGQHDFRDGIKADTIAESTADAGNTFDGGGKAKDGYFVPAARPGQSGAFGRNGTTPEFHDGTAERKLMHTHNGGAGSLFDADQVDGLDALSASAVVDPASIPAGEAVSFTVTVTGAVAGNAVHVGLPASWTSLLATPVVTAADTVTVLLFNVTDAAIDPASGTVSVVVFQ